jgi:hypothetical protein
MYVMRAGPKLGKYLSPSWRKRQPYGSAMGLQAAPQRSPFKVVADALFFRTLNKHLFKQINISLISVFSKTSTRYEA